MQMDNVRCQEEEEDEGEGYVSFDEDEPQEYRNDDSVRSKESNSSEGERDQEQLYYEYVNKDGTKTRLNFNPGSDATERVPGEVNRDHKIPLKLKRSFTDACKSETIPNNTVNAKEESVFQFSNELSDGWESSPSNSIPKRASPSKNGMNSPMFQHQRSTTPSNFYNMSKKLASPLSFLPLYNLLSAVGWSYLLYLVISLYPKVGQPAFFYQTKNVATLVQCGAIIEIINSFLGVVRSPLLTTVAQVSSRLLVVLGIFQLLPNTSGVQSVVYISLLLAWSITEIVRYLYYFFMLVFKNGAPKILILLRYNLFWILYPTGVASELRIIYCALNAAESQYSLLYKRILIAAMLAYIPGFPMLFLHMVAQRKKVMKSLRSSFGKKLI
ncbi:CBM_collapsed_G0030920.mRNA.1.CDS.1 [Saccharomyces cerevisiae]|nr:CBM_collapsed_G0030920.mRNA.1.CDS.1 [Saccharomyces cerevisiae]